MPTQEKERVRLLEIARGRVRAELFVMKSQVKWALRAIFRRGARRYKS